MLINTVYKASSDAFNFSGNTWVQNNGGNELFGEVWFLDADKAPERYRQADEEAAKRLKEQGIPGIYFTPIHEESLRAFQIFGIDDETLHIARDDDRFVFLT